MLSLLAIGIAGLGLPELLVILLIIILIFGASKLPMLGKGLGEGISNFKKGLRKEPDKLGESAETSQEGR